MTTAHLTAATHRHPLFAALLSVVMPAFNVLHDAQWRAPWRRA